MIRIALIGLPITLALLTATAGSAAWAGSYGEGIHPVPAPLVDETPTDASTETAILAGGCFWGVQGVFQHVKGVTSAVSGYTGGAQSTATYDQVSTGATGHAESVKVTFDPRQISYGKLLQIYFSVAHDPTELDFQGPDEGTQYRSAIFPTTGEQAKVAEAYKHQLGEAHTFPGKVVTTVEQGKSFFPAERHHQNFLTLNPSYPYIAINDIPKVEALKAMYPDLYRTQPVLVESASAAN